MSADASDLSLVRRVQRGDKGAFDALVLKYQHKLVKLVMRYVRNPAEAEDIAQEAFIKAYRALPQFRGDSAFYTWLYRIAINTAKNAVAMACPVGTVRSRIFRAREAIDRRLREVFEGGLGRAEELG